METPAPGTAALDADAPGTIRLTVAEARSLAEAALTGIGYAADETTIIVDQLLENALSGYRFAGLSRILAIATDEKTAKPRTPITIIRETPVSALLDGGNNIGYVAAFRGAEVAIAKARASGIAIVGVFNSYYSGRNAYYVERIARAGLVAIHTASAKPRVLPPGGKRPALGTNPLAIGFPTEQDPVIYDIGTASLMWGEVLLHARLGLPIPEGIGFDSEGRPTQDAAAVVEGGVVPFAGHKGYGLSFAIQALGLLAGASLAHGAVQDYGFLFIAVDPDLMLASGVFPSEMSALVASLKATPLRAWGVGNPDPSERAFRERAQRRREGILIDRALFDALTALAQGR